MWRRHGFTVLITASVVVFTLAFLLIAFLGPAEPTYKRLTMLQWLSAPETSAKQEAILTLGTNNLQLLVRRINYNPGKDRLYQFWKRLPDPLKNAKLIRYFTLQSSTRNAAANIMIKRLGPSAAPVIPELTQIAITADRDIAFNALLLMSHIGDPAVPGLVAAMSNMDPKVRQFALSCLHSYRNFPAAWHAVTNAITDPDPGVRQLAAQVTQPSGKTFE